jgi:hypothetical protein
MKWRLRFERGWIVGLGWRLVVLLALSVLWQRTESGILTVLSFLFFFYVLTYTLSVFRENTRRILQSGGFNVILESPGPHTSDVRIALHDYLGLDFSAAMAATERVPATVCERVSYGSAREVVDLLSNVGAKVVIARTVGGSSVPSERSSD